MVRSLQACVVVSLLLAAAPAAAQSTPPARCPNGQIPGAITGVMADRNGALQPLAVVRLVETGRVVRAADETAAYSVADLCPGRHTVTELDGVPVASITLLPGQTLLTTDLIVRESTWQTTTLTTTTILLFAVGLLLFRHHNIVRSNRELLFAQIDNLAERILLESDQDAHKQASKKLCDRAYAVKDTFGHYNPAEWFFWSRGRELAGWMRLHELERQIVAFLVPEQRVVERAVLAEAQLRQINSPSATVIADRMRQTLQEVIAATGSEAPNHHNSHAIDHLKQQLGEGLAFIYDGTDTKFAGLMEWHNKAMFLVYLSLLSIAVLGIVFHHEDLFLIGAVGGLMSRMTRTLFREDVPSDYGASWTTLFLSPLLGAISAWVGIALIVWLREMGVLGEALGNITWFRATDAVMIATAFTLGFSERLFTSLLSKVEGRVQEDLNKPTMPSAPPAPLGAPATRVNAAGAAGAGGAGETSPVMTRLDRIVQELDLKSGERAAFVGKADSPTRAALVRIVGAANVMDATVNTMGALAPLDGVLFETLPSLAAVPGVATTLASALQPDGRVVVVGSTPAALFDGDAAAQRAQDHAGPAIVREALLGAGLSAQDPPEKIGGTDPVEWIASFLKPAVGGSDR